MDNLGSHQTEIPVDVFRGFALAENVAPFVSVNANDSKRAQSFAMIHELEHHWPGFTGVSCRDAERDIEKFCNDVVGDFLLPALEFRNWISLRTSASQTRCRLSVHSAGAQSQWRHGGIQYKLHEREKHTKAAPTTGQPMATLGPIKFKLPRYRRTNCQGESFIPADRHVGLTEGNLTPAATGLSTTLLNSLTAGESPDF